MNLFRAESNMERGPGGPGFVPGGRVLKDDSNEELRRLSDDELETRTRKLAKTEQMTTLRVLDHLHEVQCRHLYAKRGFPSLFAYCTGALGYSEPAAAERVAAMRLMYAVPNVRERLESGALTLSTAARVHRFLKNVEKVGGDEKLQSRARALFDPHAQGPSDFRTAPSGASLTSDAGKAEVSTVRESVLAAVSGKSVRETDKILNDLVPEATQFRESVRRSDMGVDVRLRFQAEAFSKLERVRELRRMQGLAGVIEFLADYYLNRHDPARPLRVQAARPAAGPTQPLQSGVPGGVASPIGDRLIPLSSPSTRTSESRPKLSRATTHSVWSAADAQCQYIDPKTKLRCKARAFLQVDHIVPYAVGGPDDVSNLRLLCSAHNRWLAIQFFGEHKIPRGRNSDIDMARARSQAVGQAVEGPDPPAEQATPGTSEASRA